MKNQVQLITYVDRLAGNLEGLRAMLKGPLQGLFGTVHLLPFFDPIDGADAGFDPIDHAEVDSRLGSWADVRKLAGEIDILSDVIVNHISSSSAQLRDFSRRGAASRYNGLFLTLDSVFYKGLTEADLTRIYRPRPGLPFTVIALEDGTQRVFWTTFTSQQIDIDVRHACGREYLSSILRRLADNGVRAVRLDAVGYAIKEAGTSCFMMPQTYAFIDDFAQRARRLGMEVLVEVHSHFEHQIEIARHVDWVYDFALPPLLLHAVFFGTASLLKRWLAIRPANALTVLDTHDGIGLIDVGAGKFGASHRAGLVSPDALARVIEQIHENSRGESRRATGAAADNLDLYQINCTFYDALGRNDDSYMIARAVQFFIPGIPQVYYVGLLAGSNDLDLLERTRVGRDINRHYFQGDEVQRALQSPLVQRLLRLIRLRNAHPAFGGDFALESTEEHRLYLRWTRGREFIELSVDFSQRRAEISHSDINLSAAVAMRFAP